MAPERVRALVTIGGYNVQNTLAAPPPASAEEERALWYQWYFNTERGRVGLEQHRRDICRLLWQEWSPTWHFDDATFDRTAPSFDNPDFVPVVIHSYRHRHGNAPGDPRFDEIERRLAARPPITVPTIVLHGADDGVSPRAVTRVTWDCSRQRPHGMSWLAPAISCRANSRRSRGRAAHPPPAQAIAWPAWRQRVRHRCSLYIHAQEV